MLNSQISRSKSPHTQITPCKCVAADRQFLNGKPAHCSSSLQQEAESTWRGTRRPYAGCPSPCPARTPSSNGLPRLCGGKRRNRVTPSRSPHTPSWALTWGRSSKVGSAWAPRWGRPDWPSRRSKWRTRRATPASSTPTRTEPGTPSPASTSTVRLTWLSGSFNIFSAETLDSLRKYQLSESTYCGS